MDTTETGLNQLDNPVLLLNLAKYYGGASVRTLQMARMLQTENYPFCVVTLQNSPLFQRLQSDNLPVKSVPYGRGSVRNALWLKKLIKQENYSVIDTHNPQSHLWGLLAAKLAGHCHVVTTVHGCYGEAEKGWRAKLYDAVLQWNDTAHADFISVSDSVNIYLNNIGIKQATITYSPNAVLPVKSTNNDLTLRDLAQWDNDTLVITIAARLEPVKGIEYLLKGFAKAWQTHPKIRLCIMGDGRLRTELEQLANTLEIAHVVYFAGFREDVSTLLNSADIFCLSSLSEGLPFAVLEAAMAKLPLVLSDVGGMAEFFTHQQTALLFPVKDVDTLSQHFIRLADSSTERQQLADQTYQWVMEKFSAQRMFEQTITLYRGNNHA